MGGATETEEEIRLRIGVEAERLRPFEARRGEAGEDIGFQIELMVAGAAALVPRLATLSYAGLPSALPLATPALGGPWNWKCC